jgi:hypothetical protein
LGVELAAVESAVAPAVCSVVLFGELGWGLVLALGNGPIHWCVKETGEKDCIAIVPSTITPTRIAKYIPPCATGNSTARCM